MAKKFKVPKMSAKQRKEYQKNLYDLYASPFLEMLGWKGREEEIAYKLSTKKGSKEVRESLIKGFRSGSLPKRRLKKVI